MTGARGGGSGRSAAGLDVDGRIHHHMGMGGDQPVAARAGEDRDERHGDETRAREGKLSMDDAAERVGVRAVAVLTGGFSEQGLRDPGAVCAVRERRDPIGDLEATPFA